MIDQILIDKKVIEAFHQMWDAFPGSVRLIHKNHTVLAVNSIAEKVGFKEGLKCVCVGPKDSHKSCRSTLMLKTQEGQLDRPSIEKMRGWLPVKGYKDIYVHFTLPVID